MRAQVAQRECRAAWVTPKHYRLAKYFLRPHFALWQGLGRQSEIPDIFKIHGRETAFAGPELQGPGLLAIAGMDAKAGMRFGATIIINN